MFKNHLNFSDFILRHYISCDNTADRVEYQCAAFFSSGSRQQQHCLVVTASEREEQSKKSITVTIVCSGSIYSGAFCSKSVPSCILFFVAAFLLRHFSNGALVPEHLVPLRPRLYSGEHAVAHVQNTMQTKPDMRECTGNWKSLPYLVFSFIRFLSYSVFRLFRSKFSLLCGCAWTVIYDFR